MPQITFNHEDREVKHFIDWVLQNCTHKGRLIAEHRKSPIEGMSDYYTWEFTSQEYRRIQPIAVDTFELYYLWCEAQSGSEPLKPTLIQTIDHKFTPVNFLEYLAKNDYWLFKHTLYGVPQESFWTKGKDAKGKYTLKQLFDEFSKI